MYTRRMASPPTDQRRTRDRFPHMALEVSPIALATLRAIRNGRIELAGHLARWAASEVRRCQR